MPLSPPIPSLPTTVPPPPTPRPFLRRQSKRGAENTPAAAATNPGPANSETPAYAATTMPASLNPESLPAADHDVVDTTSLNDAVNGDAVDVDSVVDDEAVDVDSVLDEVDSVLDEAVDVDSVLDEAVNADSTTVTSVIIFDGDVYSVVGEAVDAESTTFFPVDIVGDDVECMVVDTAHTYLVSNSDSLDSLGSRVVDSPNYLSVDSLDT